MGGFRIGYSCVGNEGMIVGKDLGDVVRESRSLVLLYFRFFFLVYDYFE